EDTLRRIRDGSGTLDILQKAESRNSGTTADPWIRAHGVRPIAPIYFRAAWTAGQHLSHTRAVVHQNQGPVAYIRELLGTDDSTRPGRLGRPQCNVQLPIAFPLTECHLHQGSLLSP